MIPQSPHLPSELKFASLFRERISNSIDNIPDSQADAVIALFFLLYDCVGSGIPAYSGELKINTVDNVRSNKICEGLADAKWNTEYFIRDERWSPTFGYYFEGDKILLNSIEAEYTGIGLSEDDREARFWGLYSHLVKGLKASLQINERFPSCEVIIIGNGVGNGEEETKWVNDEMLPEDFWAGCLM